MAALPALGSLPAPPTGIGADLDASKEYFDALQRVEQSLTQRNEPNYFKMAGEFFNPGKTGNFGEALGRASSSLGEDQQRQLEQAPNIAMMRAQIAGQKYTVANTAKAWGILADATGMSPTTLKKEMGSDTPSATVTNKLSSLTPQTFLLLSRLSPDVAAAAKAAAGMAIDERKTAVSEGTLAEQQKQNTFTQHVEDQKLQNAQFALELDLLKAGNDQAAKDLAIAAFIDKVGSAKAATLGIGAPPPSVMPKVPPMPTLGAPPTLAAPPMTPPAAPPVPMAPPAAMSLQPVPTPSGPMTAAEGPVSTLNAAPVPAQPVGLGMQPPPIAKPLAPPQLNAASAPVAQKPTLLAAAPVPSGSGGSGESQRAIAVKEAEAEIAKGKQYELDREAAYKPKLEMISGYDRMTVNSNNSKYDELMSLTRKRPDLVGLLAQRSGPVAGLLTAMEEGVKAGNYNISLPVEKALAAGTFKPEDKGVARNILQLIADLNMDVMRKGKSIFGPSISTYDAQKMAEPGFKVTDPASFITYLAAKNKVVNEYMGQLSTASTRYYATHRNSPHSAFFASDEYHKIIDDFYGTYNMLVKNSPYK